MDSKGFSEGHVMGRQSSRQGARIFSLLWLLPALSTLSLPGAPPELEVPELPPGIIVEDARLAAGAARTSQGSSSLGFYCLEETHDSPAVQRQVAAVIRELARGRGVRTVLLEAPPETRLPLLRMELGDGETLAALAEAFLERGWLDGVSHAALFEALEVHGVDLEEFRRLRGEVLRKKLHAAYLRAAQVSFARRRGSIPEALELLAKKVESALEQASVEARKAFEELLEKADSRPDGAMGPAVEALCQAVAKERPEVVEIVPLWKRVEADLKAEEEADALRRSALAESRPDLERSDASMVKEAQRRLEQSGARVGVLVFGALHTPGILEALKAAGHSYRLLTPAALRTPVQTGTLARHSGIAAGEPTPFEELWKRALRPLPRLARETGVLEFRSHYTLEWRVRQFQAVRDQAAAPFEPRAEAEAVFEHGGLIPLPGRVTPARNAFGVRLTAGGKELLGVVLPEDGHADLGALRLSGHVLDFLAGGDLQPFSRQQGLDLVERAAFTRYIDLLHAGRYLKGENAAALSLFQVPGGGVHGWTRDAEGNLRRLDPDAAERLNTLLKRVAESGGVPSPILAQRAAEMLKTHIEPLFSKSSDSRPLLLLRADGSDSSWHSITSLPALGDKVCTVIATAREKGVEPPSVVSLARKVAASPSFRVTSAGQIENLIVLINTPPGATQLGPWEEAASALREYLPAGNVLLNAGKAKTLDALSHAAEMGDGVVIHIAHTQESASESGLLLGSGEVLTADDLRQLEGRQPPIWHTSLGSCRLAHLLAGGLVREALGRGAGVIGVTPGNVKASQALTFLNELLKLARSGDIRKIRSLFLPAELKRASGEGSGLPNTGFLGRRHFLERECAVAC
ncbi:MAG: hypothetical protein HY721_31150 [Planctomycetes bacterium]|nr:hypothetical protein [Planctomycetota bacterium]